MKTNTHKTNGNNMEIKVNKTTYKVTKIDSDTHKETEYTIYHLLKKNTVKTLIHNLKINEFSLWGNRCGSYTSTTPNNVDFV